MTKRIYYESCALTTQAKVMAMGHDDLGHWVVVDQTVAHVKGGGAKADRGTIGTTTFKEVVAPDGRHGDVRHYIDGEPPFAVGDVIQIEIDPEWRAIQSAFHNAGHLIAALAEEHFATLKAVNGHHYPGEARVEFVGEPFPDLNDLRASLEAALKQAIQHDLPIRVVGDPDQDRRIQIGSYPPVPCGGTHPNSTRHLGRVELKSVKAKNGKLRVSYEVFTS